MFQKIVSCAPSQTFCGAIIIQKIANNALAVESKLLHCSITTG